MSASSPRSHLRLDGISHSFGSRRVLTDITFTVSAGSPAGLIGENGSGKSTLLRIAAGLLQPDAGIVAAHVPGLRRSSRPRIGLLHQEPPFAPEQTVAQALEIAVAHIRAAAQEVDSAAAMLSDDPANLQVARAYDAALETANRLDAWSVDVRIADMLGGLSLTDLPGDRPTGALSGGQRARLSLAWLLLSTPDVLLLDEPTNHLDDAAARLVTGVLQDWRGPVLLASHDRAFLDDTVRTLIDLDPSPLPHALTGGLTGGDTGAGIGVTKFGGTYTDYVLARFDAQDRWEKQYRAEQEELDRLRTAVKDSAGVGHTGRAPRTEARSARKFYADRNAKVVSRRLRSARARLAELEEDQIRKPPPQLWFRGLTAAHGRTGGNPHGRTGGNPASTSEPVVVLTEAGVAGRLAPTSLSVGAGEKWLVTGPSGIGKSTLLGLAAGTVEATSGTVNADPRVRLGLLGQETGTTDPVPDHRTAVQVYEDRVGAARAGAVPLATFGLLPARDENRPVAELSGGQQRRLALACLLADPPDVLLLDEPTNHLSLFLATQLEAAIPDYPAAVLVASHDRRLRAQWSGRHLDLGTGR